MIAQSLRARFFYDAMRTAASACGEMTLGLHCPWGELTAQERVPWDAAAAAAQVGSPPNAAAAAFAAFNASLGRTRAWDRLSERGRGVWRWAAADLRRENGR